MQRVASRRSLIRHCSRSQAPMMPPADELLKKKNPVALDLVASWPLRTHLVASRRFVKDVLVPLEVLVLLYWYTLQKPP